MFCRAAPNRVWPLVSYLLSLLVLEADSLNAELAAAPEDPPLQD